MLQMAGFYRDSSLRLTPAGSSLQTPVVLTAALGAQGLVTEAGQARWGPQGMQHVEYGDMKGMMLARSPLDTAPTVLTAYWLPGHLSASPSELGVPAG